VTKVKNIYDLRFSFSERKKSQKTKFKPSLYPELVSESSVIQFSSQNAWNFSKFHFILPSNKHQYE